MHLRYSLKVKMSGMLNLTSDSISVYLGVNVGYYFCQLSLL